MVMKKTLLTLTAIIVSMAMYADLYEDFNSLTTGSWTGETDVNLPSGTWMFESGGSVTNTHFYNNVCFGRQEISVGNDNCNAIVAPMSKLGWTNNIVTGFSRADYVSLDEVDAVAPRRGDGSLPSSFARLMPASAMVDAGCDAPSAEVVVLAQLYIDYPQLQPTKYGTAWDMGPYEMPQENVANVLEQKAQNASHTGKVLVNGQLIIVRDGVCYDAAGKKLR